MTPTFCRLQLFEKASFIVLKDVETQVHICSVSHDWCKFMQLVKGMNF